MNLPKELTTITTVSKSLAMFLFIAVPFVGFLLGLKYEQQFTQYIESRASVDQYLLKNQPAATQSASIANWKTYAGEKFSFSYPPSMKLLNRQDSIAVTFKEPWSPDGCEFCYGYELDFKHNPLGSKSIKEIVDADINNEKENGAEIVESLRNITIAGYSGYTYASMFQIRIDYIYIPNRIDYYIKIRKVVSDPNNLGHEVTVDQILSTFRFID